MPSWKLTIDGTIDIVNDQAVSIANVRPENGVSGLGFQIGDYQSKNYVDLIDRDVQVDLAIKHKNQTYTTTFSGLVHKPQPKLTIQGEVLEVQCWGWGIALDKTLCDTSFGTESANPNTDTPEEILDYIIANEVCKRFGPLGAATEWVMDTSDIDAPHAGFSVTNLTGNYATNLTMISRLCDLINAYAVSNADIGVHWYVDTDKHFRMKEIDQDSGDSSWTRYYGGSAAAAAIKEGNNIIARGFYPDVDNYYNSIILASAFRKPAFDIWMEDNGPSWGNYQSTDSYSTDQFVVGSHSLKVTPTVNNAVTLVYYPSTHNAGWDLTRCGSHNTIPAVSFYMYTEDVDAISTPGVSGAIVIGKDWDGVVDASGNADYFWCPFNDLINDPEVDKWYHFRIPIGPHYELASSGAHWYETGSPSWDDIDFVALSYANVLTTDDVFYDDLHFSGKVVRHAYDASEITATKKERMLLIRLDTALDDTLSTTDNTGTAALLAEAELYKHTASATIGTLEFPLREDLLPGQILQVYAGKKPNGTYRWSNQAMRVRQLTHTIDVNGYRTTAELTSDVTNCNTLGIADQWGILMESAGAMGHGEAKDLKAAGIDPLIPRLAWDPT
jgi:hypothetical protein